MPPLATQQTLVNAIAATTPYANRMSLQANLKDYAWVAEIFLMERGDSMETINARFADHLLGINGQLEYPRDFVLRRLSVGHSDVERDEANTR